METTQDTPWKVRFNSKAKKQRDTLPDDISSVLRFLVAEIEQEGPVQAEWPHYGKLVGRKDMHHCHLNRGRPTYVAIWKVMRDEVCLVEIQYAGTHEKARYKNYK